MGTKNNPSQFDCYTNAEPDEPIFVLRASDPLASGLVRDWGMGRDQTVGDTTRVDEAFAVADAMDAWRVEHRKP